MVSNKLLGGGGGGLNQFYTRATIALGPAVVHEHTSFFGTHEELINAAKQQRYGLSAIFFFYRIHY